MKDVEWSMYHGEGTIECYCDNCNKNYSYEFFDGNIDFRDCQEMLKEDGWISRKIDGEWYDFCCEECYYSYIKKNK